MIGEVEVSELLLAGYAPLTRSGFALPCFAVRPQANAWYAAVCSIDGDHAGVVADFEHYDDERIASLPGALHRRIRIGDPWQDVFLINGVPHVGTAPELLRALRPELPDLLESIPLSVLDLALSAGEQDVTDFAAIAREHVTRNHGAAAAAGWQLGLLERRARLALRRKLTELLVIGAVSSHVKELWIEKQDRSYRAWLPARITYALSKDELDALRQVLHDEGARIGAPLGLGVDESASPVPAPRVLESNLSGTKSPGNLPAEDDGEDAELRIVVICSGERAQAIARHISEPDWTVDNHEPLARSWRVRWGADTAFGAPAGTSIIDVVADVDIRNGTDGYGAVVWLLDDDRVLGDGLDNLVRNSSRGPARYDGAVHLLAPALPTLGPSRVLVSLAEGQVGALPFDAVIDTSVARSPFWSGNPWRAIDRRIADTIVSSAILAASEPQIRKALLRSHRDSAPRLFSTALGRGALNGADPQLGLLSESSAMGLLPLDDDDRVFDFEVSPLERSAKGEHLGYAALWQPKQPFTAFVEAVASGILQHGGDRSSAAKRLRRRSDVFVRSKLDSLIVHPGDPAGIVNNSQLAASVRLSSGPSFVVTAEAPSPHAVHHTLKLGWEVVRYTDRETLAELLSDRSRGETLQLPRELRLPELMRLPANRGLAVRGVDPRDVIRVPLEVAMEWSKDDLGSDLVVLQRGYRVRVEETDIEEVALPRGAVRDALLSNEPAAVKLAEMAGIEDVRSGPPLKRPADLAAAWTEPAEGARRYILEDGQLPIEIAVLAPGEVPAQRMFIIDGDAAVPILFGSRLFGVWARVTMTRSTSWLPRFSVGRTFETMPIPDIFEQRRRAGTRVELRLKNTDRAATRLARAFEKEILANPSRLSSARSDSSRPSEDLSIWREVDALLLKAIGLKLGAADIDILDRLLAMNQERYAD